MADFGTTGGAGGAGSSDMLSMIMSLLGGGGDKSGLLKTILAPLLKIQERGFQPQQQSLTDAFRSAGALKGGSYGIAMPRLLGDQALARSALIGSTTSSMLGPLLELLMSSQQGTGGGRGGSGGGSGWENIPPSLGLQTPMTPSTVAPPAAPAAPPNQPIDIDKILAKILQPQGIDYSGWGNPSPAGAPPDPRNITYGPWSDVDSSEGWY